MKRNKYVKLNSGQEFLFQRIRYIKTTDLRLAVRLSNGEIKDFGYNCQTMVAPVRRRR